MTTEIDPHEEGRARFGDNYCRVCAFGGRVREGEARYSMGIYAMTGCDDCWRASGYKDVGPEAFDPLDAGERLDPDDP